jgi:lipopolysaccharide assembly protein A
MNTDLPPCEAANPVLVTSIWESPAIMKLLWWIFLLPVIAVVAAFAVANRTLVRIDLGPLPLAFDMPLYAALMVAVLAGLLIGGVSAWMAGGGKRRDVRRLRKNIKLQESEIDGLRSRLAAPVGEPEDATENKADPDPKSAAITQQAD